MSNIEKLPEKDSDSLVTNKDLRIALLELDSRWENRFNYLKLLIENKFNILERKFLWLDLKISFILTIQTVIGSAVVWYLFTKTH
jgi:hypothetical protein